MYVHSFRTKSDSPSLSMYTAMAATTLITNSNSNNKKQQKTLNVNRHRRGSSIGSSAVGSTSVKAGAGSQWGPSARTSGVVGGVGGVTTGAGGGAAAASGSGRKVGREMDPSPWVSAVLWASLHALPKVCLHTCAATLFCKHISTAWGR